MKVLIFSDIHGDTRSLARLVAQPADIYIAAGDLSTFGRGLDACGEMLRPLGERCWVLPGNHETQDDIRAFSAQYGLVDFHREKRELVGTKWAGLGYSNPTPFNTPGEYSEEEIAQALAELGKPEYFVVHTPPYGTAIDEFSPGKHAGSHAVREWVERVQPAYLFCGHVHECAGKSDRVGATQCFNVGKAGYTLEVKGS